MQCLLFALSMSILPSYLSRYNLHVFIRIRSGNLSEHNAKTKNITQGVSEDFFVPITFLCSVINFSYCDHSIKPICNHFGMTRRHFFLLKQKITRIVHAKEPAYV